MKKFLLLAVIVIFVVGGTLSSVAAKPVELTWYVPGGGTWPYPDADEVYAALNTMLERDLGVHVTFKTPGSFGEYRQKMPVIMAAGEPFDLVWTSHWCNNYLSAVNDELYASLDELLPQYGPTLLKDTKDVLEAARVHGKIYGVTIQTILAKTSNVVVWESHREKYGWDVKAVKSLKDIEPFLADIKANEPDLIPLGTRKPAPMWAEYSLGYTRLFSEKTPLAVSVYDKECKVVNLLKDPDFVANIKLAHEWFKKGYIAKDGLTYTGDQWRKLWNSGKVAVDLHNTWSPAEYLQQQPFGETSGRYPYGPSFVEGPSVTSTMTAISSQSKHQDKAVQLLEYLYTNREARTLLICGIEGKHYQKLEDGRIKRDATSGYYPVTWVYVMGNEKNSYVEAPTPLDLYKKLKELNDNAIKPPILGFMPDMEPIKSLLASVSAANDQYRLAVLGGYVDPETELPKYIDALKQSGIDELIEQVQAQIDAWKAGK